MTSQAVRFVILGQAASKANSRQLVTLGGKPRIIKSPEARAFLASARQQVPPAARVRMRGPVCVTLHMHYLTERPDLDESVVLDALQDVWKVLKLRSGNLRELVQGGVYCNDRQVREKHVFHHIDRTTPRVEVLVEPIGSSTLDLFVVEAA